MNITWYLFPLAAAVSLVWNTSRYEFTPLILQRSLKLFLQIILFMAVILAVLALCRKPRWPALIYGPLAALAGLLSLMIM